MGISSSHNSFKTCLQIPHGDVGFILLTVTVIDSKSPGCYPRAIAAARLDCSAQIVAG